VMFGRVPFAFYVVHWFVMHTACVLLGVAQGFPASALMDVPGGYPPTYGLPLAGVYVVWIGVLVVMYPWVRWVAGVKARNRAWYLSYV